MLEKVATVSASTPSAGTTPAAWRGLSTSGYRGRPPALPRPRSTATPRSSASPRRPASRPRPSAARPSGSKAGIFPEVVDVAGGRRLRGGAGPGAPRAGHWLSRGSPRSGWSGPPGPDVQPAQCRGGVAGRDRGRVRPAVAELVGKINAGRREDTRLAVEYDPLRPPSRPHPGGEGRAAGVDRRPVALDAPGRDRGVDAGPL